LRRVGAVLGFPLPPVRGLSLCWVLDLFAAMRPS